HQVFADRLLPMLDEAWTAAEDDPDLSEYRDREDVARLVTLLRDEWDRKMERDSSAALAFELFAFHAAVRVLEDDLMFLFDAVLDASTVTVLSWTTQALEGGYPDADLVQEGRDAILLDALAATADVITERWGGVDPDMHDYKWGDFHGTLFDNPLAGSMLDYGWVPTDGGTGTVNVSGDSPFGDGVVDRLESTGGAIFRSVTTFAEDGTPQTVANFPIGVSGEPDSELWDHTLDDWVEDVYRPLPFERSDVEADMMDRATLSP
ncbi:MAG: penicillin acylase family protein, partial [Polyangiales bacterium]